MKLALVTLSLEGAEIATRIAAENSDFDLFMHSAVKQNSAQNFHKFDRVIDLTRQIFSEYSGIVYIMPTGVVTRAIAPCIEHKLSDPAVVAVDIAGRWAISLLSGHEGGANTLAMNVANILNAEPIVTTTTEAIKDIIIGVGCRRGTCAKLIDDAIKSALQLTGLNLSRVRLLASADLKKNEAGLLQISTELEIPIRFISAAEIKNSAKGFTESNFVKSKIDLPAVCEPAALLAGRRTELLLPKTIFKDVTIAIARERFLWSE